MGSTMSLSEVLASVRAEEREACARIAEEIAALHDPDGHDDTDLVMTEADCARFEQRAAQAIADAIRARGAKPTRTP